MAPHSKLWHRVAVKMSTPHRDASHWYAAAGLVAVLAIDRLAHTLFGDVTLAPLVSVIVLASLTLRLKARDILLWTPLYVLLTFLLLTYWRGSFVRQPGPLPPDLFTGMTFWRTVVRSFTVAVAGGLCAALSLQRQRLQALLEERIAVDAALTESHARINLAARTAQLGFWHFRVAENREEWDESLRAIYGSDVADPARKNYVHPEDREAAENRRRDALRAGGSYESEFRIVRPDGEVRHIQECGIIMRDAKGKVVGITGADIDITERRRVSRELEETRRSLEKSAYEATENMPVGTYALLQPPGGGFARFSFMSSRFLELLGLTREAADRDQLNVFACVHPEEYDEFLRKNIETFEHKLPFSEEFRALIAGKTRWFHAASNPRPLPDGSTVWEGVLTDITARKEAELAGAKSERSMKLAASAARLGFWDIDISTRLDRWDEEMARIHGIRHGDFDGHWEKFVHPDDYEEVMRETRRMLESDTTFEMDYRIVRPSGEVRYIREHGIVVRDKAGRPVSASGIMQDITERKLAREAANESGKRMQLAASAAGIGFWSRNNATGIEEWDDEMLRIYGVRREDFDGRWEPFIHPDDVDRVPRIRPDEAQASQVNGYEYRIVRPDGEVRHLRAMCTFIPDPQGGEPREIGVNFDITAEKEAAERDRQLAEEHRRELEKKLKTSLSAAAVAHEINQPLSAILLDSQMALERIKGDSSEPTQVRAFISSIISNAERTVDTIGRMMSLLRSVQTNPQEVDLSNVVRSAELYAKDDLREAKIALHVEGAGRAVKIRGDEGQILLAVSNLLRNAIEAIGSGNTGRPPEIVMTLAPEGKSIVLSVADSGPGLPRETLAKIPLNTTKPEGTGLGLFIVQSVAENHGATLEAGTSQLGGAELRLVFPALRKKA